MTEVPVRLARIRRPVGGLFPRLALVIGSTMIGIVFCAQFASIAEASGRPFRLAFSSSMFTEVNESDARAAMKIWIMTVAEERGLWVDPEPFIAGNIDELARVCRSPRIDGCAVILPEYARLSREIDFSHFAVGISNGAFTEEYLLLTRRDSGLERIEQLRGRRVAVLHNPRMSLALIWLDTLMLEAGLDPADAWFGETVLKKSPAHTALPVFFSKIDACLMTRSSFEMMAELNPQLQEQLHAMAASPPFVPSGFAYRMDASDSFLPLMIEAMEQLRESPAGLQILQLVQAERIESHPISVLDPSLELLERHGRLLDDAGKGRKR
jgi:ABC-type phosphate/phosphonate transport system substrate-binding protein